MPTWARTDSSCVMCGRTPRTRAHIIAKNIRDVLPRDGHRTTNVVAEVPVSARLPKRSNVSAWNNGAHMLDAQPRVLCADCNNDWMNRLEEAATPIIADLITGATREIAEDQARSVAEWALAAAIVRAEMTDMIRPVDADLRKAFRVSGLEALPVSVDLYALVHEPGSRVTQRISSSVVHDAVDGNVPGHMIAFWLESLGIVVALEEFVARANRAARVLNRSVLRVWPTPSPSTWPPAGAVDPAVVMDAYGFAPQLAPALVFDHRRYKELGRSFSVTQVLDSPVSTLDAARVRSSVLKGGAVTRESTNEES